MWVTCMYVCICVYECVCVRVCVCVRALSVCVFKCCCPAEGAGGQAPVVGNVCAMPRDTKTSEKGPETRCTPHFLQTGSCSFSASDCTLRLHQCLVTQRHQKKARKGGARHISCGQVLVHLVPQTAPMPRDTKTSEKGPETRCTPHFLQTGSCSFSA